MNRASYSYLSNEALNQLREIHRKNLDFLNNQVGKLGDNIPLSKHHEINHEIESLQAVEAELQRRGIQVNDNFANGPNNNPVSNQQASSNATTGQETILFMSSDPSNKSRLRLDQEYRDIQETLRLGKERERLNLVMTPSTRVRDITQAFLDYEPTLLHFAGHAETEGLMFEDETGKAFLVQKRHFADIFEVHDCVRCVVLNACYSQEQAEALIEYVDYVIGMSAAITDRAAIQFAVGFYQAFAAGKPIDKCFKNGKLQIGLHNLDEKTTPRLYTKHTI